MSIECKQIAIITLTKDFNYGNRLQNFATQIILQNMGYEVHTLFNSTDSEYMKQKSVKDWIKYILNYKRTRLTYQIASLFDEFNNNNIVFGEEIRKGEELRYLNNLYSIFITGSDQVWNPKWSFLSGIEYLDFVEDDKIKISLSASFGVSEIPKEKHKMVGDYLKRFQYLSVREDAGAEIIKKLVNRNAEVLIDPTMFISQEQWIELEKRPKGLGKEEYILIYILGSYNHRIIEKVSKFTQERKIKIYNLSKNRLNNTIPVGPEEFLYLIHNAKYIITDSFHGSVFSILFETNFYVFKRENLDEDMSSRIVTLLKKMHLDDRYTNANDMNFESINEVTWEKTKKYLSSERENFMHYIELALKSESKYYNN